MKIANVLAGFSLAQADSLRRAISKKKPEIIEAAKKQFIDGCMKNGMDAKLADRVFQLIMYFGGYGFNKCVVGATRIPDARTGRIWTAEELCRTGARISVWSLTKEGRCVARPLVRVWTNGVRPVYELRTALGKTIRVTANHPFHTFKGWRELSTLKPGDRIAVPRVLPHNGARRWQEHELALLGWVLSEGNTCHPSGFYLYSTDAEQTRDMIRSAAQFENTATTVHRRRGLNEIFVRSYSAGDGRFHKGQAPWNGCRNAPLGAIPSAERNVSGARLWLEQLHVVGRKATEKFIPPEVFQLSPDSVALFLGRLWSGDGFIFGPHNTAPFYATSSCLLAQGVQELLLRLGIVSRLAQKSFPYRGTLKPGYALYLVGPDSMERFVHVLGPHLIGRSDRLRALSAHLPKARRARMSKDTIPVTIRNLVQTEKLKAGGTWGDIEAKTGVCVREIAGHSGLKKGFRRWTIQALAEHFESPELKLWAESDIFWDTVVEIKPDGREQTYDLEIQETHNFLADGIFVHNSHSTAYALICYRTAYLKAHYPVEFMTAVLSSEKDNTDKVVQYIDESKRMGINILPPDVDESFPSFTVVGEKAIRFGLAAVKNVGQAAIDSIIQARIRHGRLKNFFDFVRQVDSKAVNRKTLECLIKCGAFDTLGLRRSQLSAVIDKAIGNASEIQKDRAVGQLSLFDAFDKGNGFEETLQRIPDIPEWEEHEKLGYEKELLGFYVTGHPLERHRRAFQKYADTTTATIHQKRDQEEALIGALVNKLKVTTTRKTGERMAILTLEDLEGIIEALVFPRPFKDHGDLLAANAILFFRGRVDKREDEPKLIVEEIYTLETIQRRMTRSVVIDFRQGTAGEEIFVRIQEVLSRFAGETPVYLHVVDSRGEVNDILVDRSLFVRPTEDLVSSVEHILGPGRIHLQV